MNEDRLVDVIRDLGIKATASLAFYEGIRSSFVIFAPTIRANVTASVFDYVMQTPMAVSPTIDHAARMFGITFFAVLCVCPTIKKRCDEKWKKSEQKGSGES